MRQYEIGVILDADMDEAALPAMSEKIEGWITGEGGTVNHTEQKLKRRLADPINKKTEGHYVFWYANLPANGSAEIERNLSLEEDVLRFMVIRNDFTPTVGPEQSGTDEELEVTSDEASIPATHEDVSGE